MELRPQILHECKSMYSATTPIFDPWFIFNGQNVKTKLGNKTLRLVMLYFGEL